MTLFIYKAFSKKLGQLLFTQIYAWRKVKPGIMGDILLLYSRTYAWRKVKCVPLLQKEYFFD